MCYYTPFGWNIPSRTYSSGNYRYGFNGKENDSDYGSDQLIQDYGFRIYNPSIGRFLSVDPLAPDYPWYTPYQFAGNTPVQAIDLDGLEPARATARNSPQMRVVVNNLQLRRALRPMNNARNHAEMMRRSASLMEGGIDASEQHQIENADQNAFGNDVHVYMKYRERHGESGNAYMVYKDLNRVNRILQDVADKKILSADDANYYNQHLKGEENDSKINEVDKSESTILPPPEFLDALRKKVSTQKQARHIIHTPEYKARGGVGSYFHEQEDAQKVLDAVNSGEATYLGANNMGQHIFRYKGVEGYNNSPGAGYVDQPTNVFIVKGTKSPSVVPTNPNWKPKN